MGVNQGYRYNTKVFDAYRAQEIKLIPLVPNATHLIQP